MAKDLWIDLDDLPVEDLDTPRFAKAKPAQPISADSAVLKHLFLVYYGASGDLGACCKQIGVPRGTVSDWCESDTDFMIAYGNAQKEATDLLKATAFRLATQGHSRHKFHGGQMVMVRDPETGEKVPYVEYTISESMIMFLLRALEPGTYGRDPVTLENTPQPKAYVLFDPTTVGSDR